MFKAKTAFSGFSVIDLKETQKFYAEILGLAVEDNGMGLQIHLPHGGSVFAYSKGNDHQSATFTILNLVVDDIDKAVDALVEKRCNLRYIKIFLLNKMKKELQEVGRPIWGLTSRGLKIHQVISSRLFRMSKFFLKRNKAFSSFQK